MANEDLIIRIGAKTAQYEHALKVVGGKTEAFNKRLASLSKISAAAFVGIAGAIGLTVKEFAEFDDGIRGVKTLLNETSFGAVSLSKGFEKLRKDALDLAAEAPIAIDELNKALFDTVSAGIEAGKAVDVVRVAAELAVAGQTDLAIATDGITSALNAYNLGADQAEEVASKFFQAQVEGKTTIKELSKNFGKAGATAEAYGVSLDELLASTSAVTAGGVKTEAAFTGLNALMVNISKPTADASKEAKKLGIEFNSTALRAQGLEGFLNTLTQAEGFTNESIEKLFGSVEAQKVAFALTGSQAERFANTIEKLGNKTKTAANFQKAYEEQSASLKNVIKELRNGITVLAITLGSKLAPLIEDLAGLVKNAVDNIRALDDEQIESIATALKWAAAITGGVAAITAFGVVAIKISTAIGALTLAFGPATLGASAFWVAVTGPIGIAVIGIAAVTAGAYALFKVFEDPEPPQRLEDINGELRKLEEQEKKLEETANTNRLGQKNRSQLRLEEIQGEISELKKLQSQKIEDSASEETGSLLLRPKIDRPFQEVIDEEILGIEPVDIPLRPASQPDDEGPSEAEKEKTKVLADATKERIKILENEREVNRAIAADAESDEIEFIKRRQDLKLEEIEAQKILNDTERNLAVENVRLKNEQLETEEEEAFIKRQETEAERMEQQKILDEELQALSEEERAALTEKDLDMLRTTAQTKQQAHADAGKQKLLAQRKENKIFEENAKKHGKAVALINKAMHSAIFQGSKRAFGELAQLQQSSNSKLKSIGKISAIANIVIKTAESAMNVYNGFSTIPILGQPLGIAGAIAAVAFGAEQIGKVRGANKGGVASGTGGIPGVDSLPFMLTPGELISPEKNFDETVEGVARQRGFVKRDEVTTSPTTAGSEGGGGVRNEFIITGEVFDNDAFIDNVIEKVRDKVLFENADIGVEGA